MIRQLVGEGTFGELACLVAQRDDLRDQWVGVTRIKLSPADPAHLTVVLVGAEQPVSFAQKVKCALNARNHLGRVDVRAPNVDADRHTHDLLDPGTATHRWA